MQPLSAPATHHTIAYLVWIMRNWEHTVVQATVILEYEQIAFSNRGKGVQVGDLA